QLPSICDTAIWTVVAERRSLRGRGNWTEPGFPAAPSPVTSYLGVPIASATSVYGWIMLANKRGAPEFSTDDEEIATALATQAAVAYENVRLYEDLRLHTSALEQEITKRKGIEEQLRNNEERTLLALNAARMGVWEWDLVADRVTGSDVGFGLALQDAPRS